MLSIVLHTYCSVNGAESDGEYDKPGVPVVFVVDRRNPQEHENDCLRT